MCQLNVVQSKNFGFGFQTVGHGGYEVSRYEVPDFVERGIVEHHGAGAEQRGEVLQIRQVGHNNLHLRPSK